MCLLYCQTMLTKAKIFFFLIFDFQKSYSHTISAIFTKGLWKYSINTIIAIYENLNIQIKVWNMLNQVSALLIFVKNNFL